MTEKEYKRIFDRYFDQLRNYVLYCCGDEALSSDIVQECFIKLWKIRNNVKMDTIASLLYTMASNKLKSEYRHNNVVLQLYVNYQPNQNVTTPEDETISNETRLNLEKAIGNLPEKQRTVFLMSRNDGLKYQEIADCLGISVKAVEKRMSKALQELKAKILNQ